MPPASLAERPFIVLDAVVTEQWPSTLPLVNAPTDMLLLNPGQCVRVAPFASGKGHEHFLDDAAIGFTVRRKGADQSFPVTPAAATKLVKPEGGDFVTEALAAAAIKNPLASTASIAVSASKWCAPQDAADEAVEVSAIVKLTGPEVKLKTVTIQVESIGTAAKKTFADDRAFSAWMQAYHASPEPGRLLPAIGYFAAHTQAEAILLTFFKSALQQDAATAQGFGPYISSEKRPRMLALALLAKAGVTLNQPPQLSDEDKKFIAEEQALPDPYDMKPDRELFGKLDMLWAEFSATGNIKPVSAIVSALAWRADYDAFDQMRKKGIKPDGLTDSIARGVTYMAAGWSLGSFQQNDPLATDYLAWIASQPSTPDAIKQELSALHTNPAFKQQ